MQNCRLKLATTILVYTVAMPTIMSQRLLLNIHRDFRAATIDAAAAGIETWLTSERSSPDDIQDGINA